jgi:hypothetical protein
MNRWKAFFYGQSSAAVELLAGVLVVHHSSFGIL